MAGSSLGLLLRIILIYTLPMFTDRRNLIPIYFGAAMRNWLAIMLTLLATLVEAEDMVYQEPTDFLVEVFAGQVPTPRLLWLDESLRMELKNRVSYIPKGIRIRYWGENGRTAWVLNEIGKDRPITTGVVVDGDVIESMKVLVYRESRGWEVKYPFFTDQFRDLRLTQADRLDGTINSITGATLSVRALKKVAAAALVLHAHSDEANTNIGGIK